MALEEKNPTVKQAVRASVTIGEIEYDVLHFDPAPTASVDSVEIKTVGAAKTAYLPGAIENTAAIEVKVLAAGNQPAVGDIVDVKIDIDEATNGVPGSATVTKTVSCFVQQVAHDRIEGDGATRQEAWTLTLQPTNV